MAQYDFIQKFFYGYVSKYKKTIFQYGIIKYLYFVLFKPNLSIFVQDNQNHLTTKFYSLALHQSNLKPSLIQWHLPAASTLATLYGMYIFKPCYDFYKRTNKKLAIASRFASISITLYITSIFKSVATHIISFSRLNKQNGKKYIRLKSLYCLCNWYLHSCPCMTIDIREKRKRNMCNQPDMPVATALAFAIK